jgi:flagellar biogenesis protein FliO
MQSFFKMITVVTLFLMALWGFYRVMRAIAPVPSEWEDYPDGP